MKTFTLYKRGSDGRPIKLADLPNHRERPWQFKFEFRGVKYSHSLETADAKEAQAKANRLYTFTVDKIKAGESERLDDIKLRRPHRATIEQLREAYLKSPSDAGAATRKQNLHALKQIIGDAAHVVDLLPQLARQWFATATAAAHAEPDQEAGASLKRSANSRWVQATGVFTAKCLQYYKDQGLWHKCMEEFVAAGEAAKFSGRALPKISYNPPSEEIIAATLKAWSELGNSHRDLFLAIGHELAFGLRAHELTQAVWGWWTIRAGYPALDGKATVKAGTGLVQVRALDPWFSTMRNKIEANHWRGKDDEYIIPGTDTYRKDAIFRAVSDWLRALGWETQKTNHALRAFSGSQIAMKYGIYDAQSWLRHSTVKVTEQHYTHFVTRFKPADLDTLPARWATTTREFKPVIIEHQAATA